MRSAADFARGAVLVILLAVVAAPGVWAQDAGSFRDRYVMSVGLGEERETLREYLYEQLVTQGHENAARLSDLFSFVMLIHGLDLEKVARLQAGGIDIVHAMTSNARPFLEQGLFSSPVLVGDVIERSDEGEPDDGFGSTVSIRVVEVLKGAAPDTVFLRQRGRFSEGMGPREFVPEAGRRYLLLFSRPMYEFFVWRRGEQGGEPFAAKPGHYSLYRYYLSDDARVVMGDGSSYGAETVYQQLRWLDELVEEL